MPQEGSLAPSVVPRADVARRRRARRSLARLPFAHDVQGSLLDTQGLVVPQRTPAGYRLYSAADVERLRYVLRQQRDAYAPLSVIRERLELSTPARHTRRFHWRPSASRGPTSSRSRRRRRLTGSTAEMIALLASEGVVEQSAPGRFERSDVALLGACVHYLDAGADVRQLRALSRTAQREVEAAESLAAPLKRQDDDSEATSSRHSSSRRCGGGLHGVCATRGRDEALIMGRGRDTRYREWRWSLI